MSVTDKTTSGDGPSMSHLQRSLEEFSNKVDANYRAFYSEGPPIAERQRNLLYLWFLRAGIKPAARKNKK